MTVSPGQPGSISDDAEVVTLVASGHDASLINQREVHWGVRKQSLPIILIFMFLDWIV